MKINENSDIDELFCSIIEGLMDLMRIELISIKEKAKRLETRTLASGMENELKLISERFHNGNITQTQLQKDFDEIYKMQLKLNELSKLEV